MYMSMYEIMSMEFTISKPVSIIATFLFAFLITYARRYTDWITSIC